MTYDAVRKSILQLSNAKKKIRPKSLEMFFLCYFKNLILFESGFSLRFYIIFKI